MRYLILFLITILHFQYATSQCNPSGIPEFSANVLSRSSESDLDQPFIAGEEVFIRISFNTNRDSASRLMHGIIPTFGPGWDYDKIDFNFFNPIFGYHHPEWFDTQEDCPPFTKKDIPSLCTYYDINGNLQLCNFDCEICPCTEGLKAEEILPSGWFYNFNPSSCINGGECILTNSWGPWGVHISHNGELIILDILLTVDTHVDIDSCETRKDLSIGIQEIYDDITGCFSAEESSVSAKLITDEWLIDCTQPPITTTFNKLKFIIYHDENQDGIKNEDEDLISLLTNFELLGDSISGYSEQLKYYLLSGNEYTAVCDTNNFIYNYALTTPASVDISFADGDKEKEVEFGVYMKPTSVNTKEKERGITVFPNPTTTKLSINLPKENYLIKLVNIEGSVIYKNISDTKYHTINTSELTPGIYYLSIYDAEYRLLESQKVVKY